MIIVQLIEHRNEKRIRVDAQNEYNFRFKIKKIMGRRWSATKTCWHIPYQKTAYNQLQTLFGKQNIQVISPLKTTSNHASVSIIQTNKAVVLNDKNKNLNPFQEKVVQAFEKKLTLEQKNWRTIKNYPAYLKELFLFYPRLKPSEIREEQIEQFMRYKIQNHKITLVSQNQILSAIVSFYDDVLEQELCLKSISKLKKVEPTIKSSSKKEIVQLMMCLQNIKHKVVLALVHFAGLSHIEIVNLKKSDINLKEQVLSIKGVKGKKRTIFLTEKIIHLLHTYLSIYHPRYWLFEGQRGGQYSTYNIQAILQKLQ